MRAGREHLDLSNQFKGSSAFRRQDRPDGYSQFIELGRAGSRGK